MLRLIEPENDPIEFSDYDRNPRWTLGHTVTVGLVVASWATLVCLVI